MSARVFAASALLALAVAAPAEPASFPVRTFAVSSTPNGSVADGASTRPAMSASGDLVAFDSTATNLAVDPNGAVRDVFARLPRTGTTYLVSQAPSGGADGPSSHAAVGGGAVVFQSDATNLVDGDTNGVRDVFARTGTGPVVRISVADGGAQADGPSGNADVSADGRFAVFVSTARNLVAGDADGDEDVFLRDLRAGRTRRIAQGTAPAISPDGRFVSYYSGTDVMLADTERGTSEVISVSSSEVKQNASVVAPFSQVSDVSRDGRLVVFDSDATNLVPNDRNRDTDVFVRDRGTGQTRRVSVDKFGFEADNDSFYPSISPDGRFVVFDSFASNLAAGDGPGEDAFVYDRVRKAPITASVGAEGQRRGRELTRQILQRPRVSADGRVVAFTSTAPNLIGRDGNRAEDVFLRLAAPPKVRIVRGPRGVVRSDRPLLQLAADDPHVREFICSLNGVRIRCDRRSRLPRLGPGRHVLEVRAGGPGMLFQAEPVRRRYRIAG